MLKERKRILKGIKDLETTCHFVFPKAIKNLVKDIPEKRKKVKIKVDISPPKINRLNLGCGEDYRKGCVNVDIRLDLKTDVYCDLNKYPYPFRDDFFEEVLIYSTLEHLENPIKCLKEVRRISQNNAKIFIKVPHAYSHGNATDLQHRWNFTENTFSKGNLKEYGLNLILIKVKFSYEHTWKRLIPFKKLFNCLYDDIKFILEVKKNRKI